MKKFKFALDTVLSYKKQVLDALRGEHAEALAKVLAGVPGVQRRVSAAGGGGSPHYRGADVSKRSPGR